MSCTHLWHTPSNVTVVSHLPNSTFHCLSTFYLSHSYHISTWLSSLLFYRRCHPPSHTRHILISLLFLSGDIHLISGPSQPTEFLLCSFNARSLLCSILTTALSELTDQHRLHLIAITETWVRPTSTFAELIDAPLSGYILFSAPCTSPSSISKNNCVFSGGTGFLLKEPSNIIQSSAHVYSFFEYSALTIKLPTFNLTVFNLYRPPPPSPYSQLFTTFTDQLIFSYSIFHYPSWIHSSRKFQYSSRWPSWPTIYSHHVNTSQL